MRWSEQQRRLLGAMGVRLFERPTVEPAPAPIAAPVPMPSAAPAGPVPGDARTALIARLDWAALRDAVATCTACALCESRTQTVFGVGLTGAADDRR
jgi:hypothetical protein